MEKSYKIADLNLGIVFDTVNAVLTERGVPTEQDGTQMIEYGSRLAELLIRSRRGLQLANVMDDNAASDLAVTMVKLGYLIGKGWMPSLDLTDEEKAEYAEDCRKAMEVNAMLEKEEGND